MMKETFPKFYQEALDSIPVKAAKAMSPKIPLAASPDETIRQPAWDYLHDYQLVTADAFHAFDLPGCLDRFPEEIARYADRHPAFAYDALCAELEKALKSDPILQTRMHNLMVNTIFYAFAGNWEDITIRNCPVEFPTKE